MNLRDLRYFGPCRKRIICRGPLENRMKLGVAP